MYWVDRSTGEIVSERDKNKPLCAYYEYLRGFGDGVIIETYIIGENPFCRIDFAYCVGGMYVNLKRDYHFKNTAWIRTTLDWTPYRFRLKNMTKR